MDVKGTLSQHVSGNSISIPAGIFGTGAIETAINNYLSGKTLNIDGITLTGDTTTATISGKGNNAPFGQTSVTAVFTAQNGGVSMNLTATIQPGWTLAQAFPGQLSSFPFNQLALTQATFTLQATVGSTDVDLTATASASFQGQPLGMGILEVKYASGSLGFTAGFLLTGSWSPSGFWSPLADLTFTEVGVFLSTLESTDLSAFKALKVAYLPDSVGAGLTLLASLSLAGTIEPLKELFPTGTTLDLLATIPVSGDKGAATLEADLELDIALGVVTFQGFTLDWDISAQTISLSANGTIVDTDYGVNITVKGEADINYGATPNFDFGIYGSWPHPFGAQDISINNFGIAIGFTEEGTDLQLGGDIEFGPPAQIVDIELIVSITDFEVPTGLVFKLKAGSGDKPVPLSQILDSFLPGLDAEKFPLLNDIAFNNLMLLIVADPFVFDGFTYDPGFGATGDIKLFDYELDFGFMLDTKSKSLKAKGNLSKNGGPIVLTVGSVTLLKLSDSTGTKGPSGCIDTSGSGYCNDTCTTCGSSGISVNNAYLCLNGAVEVLGLRESLCAVVTESAFQFDVAFSFLGVVKGALACTFDPGAGNFAAGIQFGFSLPTITLGPYKIDGVTVIPQISIPLPSASISLNVSNTSLSFGLQFSWGQVDFDIQVSLDLQAVANAFTDFATWLVNWLENNAALVFEQFLSGLEDVAKAFAALLYQAGVAIADAVQWVAHFFGDVISDVEQFVTGVWDWLSNLCSTNTADSAMNGSSSALMTPVLADLTESSRGQAILYHYYLHQEEIHRLLAPGSPAGERVRGLAAGYLGGRRALPAPFVPEVRGAMDELAAAAGPELQASVAEVAAALDEHGDRTYREFLAALRE